jgi:PDZ/DHR/GLGF domain protein
MDLSQILYLCLHGAAKNCLNPIFWIAVLVCWQLYRKNGASAAFARRITLYSTLEGVVAGLVAVSVMVVLGLSIQPGIYLILLFPVALLLSLIHPRFLCFSYSAALITAVSRILHPWLNLQADAAGLMAVIAVLHFMEAILVLVGGDRQKQAILAETDLGLRPGWSMNRYWPVSLGLLLVTASGMKAARMPEWWPLLAGGESLIYGLLPMTAMLGYSNLAVKHSPRMKCLRSGGKLVAYGGILLLLSLWQNGNSIREGVGLLFQVLGHEWILQSEERAEKNLAAPLLKRIQGR